MEQSNVFAFENPGRFSDSLAELLRRGASQLLTSAIEAEVRSGKSRFSPEALKDSRRGRTPGTAPDAGGAVRTIENSRCTGRSGEAGLRRGTVEKTPELE